ncbi:MAG: hypothetical protein HeimC3_10020 [Candidatus Heimdallarchaeota archaeon LC_3]|nr:MAG: hypothetical protein HeimC3_10020 [Candidatus Heimdallarchaeota archaeon LC_3]
MSDSLGIFRKLTITDWPIIKELDGEAFPNDEIAEEDFNRLTLSDGFIGCFNKNQSNDLIGYLFLT